jgi:hypothetical protein
MSSERRLKANRAGRLAAGWVVASVGLAVAGLVCALPLQDGSTPRIYLALAVLAAFPVVALVTTACLVRFAVLSRRLVAWIAVVGGVVVFGPMSLAAAALMAMVCGGGSGR